MRSSSISGALHRRWVDIKGVITGKDDEAILNECERGEDVAEAELVELGDGDLPLGGEAQVLRGVVGVAVRGVDGVFDAYRITGKRID